MKAGRRDVERLLRTARGQLDGLLRMVEEDRYCIDISNQLLATIAILSRVNREVLDAHLESCVHEALTSGDEQLAHARVDEVMGIIRKLAK